MSETTSETTGSTTLFLLNPHHRPFVEGTSRQLGSAERAYHARTFQLGPPTIIALLVCLVWIGWIITNAWEERQINTQLEQAGETTEATITELRDDGGALQPYTMSYRFDYTAPEGETATATAAQPITRTEYERLSIGDTISIRYLPTDTSVARYASDVYNTSLWTCIPFLIVPLLAGYIFSWYHSLGHWRQLRQLEKEGQLLDGTVIACSKGIPLPKDRRQVWLEYRFRTPDGQELHNRGEGSMEDDDPLPAPGTPIKVLYVNDDFYRVL